METSTFAPTWLSLLIICFFLGTALLLVAAALRTTLIWQWVLAWSFVLFAAVMAVYTGLLAVVVAVFVVGGVVLLAVTNRRQHVQRTVVPAGVVGLGNVPARALAHAEPKVRPTHCPECGVSLPADSPDGLCPECLLRCGLSNAEREPASHQGAST